MNRLAVLAACLAHQSPAQAVAWFEGASPTSLALRRVFEASPGATPVTLLTDVELLPIEMTGRTLAQELDPSRSRRITRLGTTRIELPHGGRLLAYRRAAAQTYGFLLVDAGGMPSVLVEGAAFAGQSPFADRLGVSPDGLWAVVPSQLGDRLHVLRLDGGTFASTGTPARTVILPAPVETESVMPGRSMVFFATDDERLRRCAMGDGGQVEDAGPPPIVGARVKSELALSGDGSRAVYLYGVQPAFSLWMVGETGPSVRLNAPVAKYEEPNYLPVFPTGPKMLLNHDGSRLMYTDSTSRDEIFLMDTTGATATTQVTSDDNFEPYIGIGIFPTFAAATLVLGVGDPDAFDVVAAVTGGLPVANLTLTSSTPRPYSPGTLVPTAVTSTLGGGLLITDRSTGSLRLLDVDPATGAVRVVAEQLRQSPWLGDAHAGVPDFVVPTNRGDALLDGITGRPVFRAPAGVAFATEAMFDSTLRVLSVDAGTLSATAFITAGGVVALPPVASPQRASLTGSRNLLLDGPGLLHVEPIRGATMLQTSGNVRVVVSGRGA